MQFKLDALAGEFADTDRFGRNTFPHSDAFTDADRSELRDIELCERPTNERSDIWADRRYRSSNCNADVNSNADGCVEGCYRALQPDHSVL